MQYSNPVSVTVYETAQGATERLARKPSIAFNHDEPEIENKLINIHPEVTYQEIEGFGGAFTEAGAVTLDAMSPARRAEVLRACFDPREGLGYTFCRTHINSCDFSLGNYAYVEDANDLELKSFSIARDQRSLIPLIKDAMALAGSEFRLFASPWSPPAWMKTNGAMNQGGKLKSELAAVWARYYCKYIDAYAAQGVPIWGLTVQNEAKAVQRWDSCIYTAAEERDFVRDHLGPALHRNGKADIKIMVWDHNRERVFERAKEVFGDPEAAKYIWGTGFHWYSGDHFENLEMTNKAFPGKKLIFTEGCVEGGVQNNRWETGERYGHDLIGCLNNHTVAWVDWNMVLNQQGGPNHVGNYCAAPIIANTATDTVTYQNSYSYIGHITRFIRPGAKRIGFSRYTDKLEVTACLNPDGTIVVVVLNRTDCELPFNLRGDHGVAPCISRPHSIQTLVYEN